MWGGRRRDIARRGGDLCGADADERRPPDGGVVLRRPPKGESNFRTCCPEVQHRWATARGYSVTAEGAARDRCARRVTLAPTRQRWTNLWATCPEVRDGF